jgi:hypothetical protein
LRQICRTFKSQIIFHLSHPWVKVR